MSMINLSPATEQLVKKLDLPNHKEEQLRFCVISYTKPNGFCNYLQYLAFRTWNTFKSVFGCSTWQQSIMIIQETAFERAKAKFVKYELNEKEKSKMEHHIYQNSKKSSEFYLEHCLLLHHIKAPASEIFFDMMQTLLDDTYTFPFKNWVLTLSGIPQVVRLFLAPCL